MNTIPELIPIPSRRIRKFLGILACGLPLAVSSQTAQPETGSDWSIVQKGPHSQTWQRVVNQVGPGGQLFPQVHTYVELRSCMNVLSNGLWVTATDEISPTATGAQATNAQVAVSWLGNINSASAVTLTTPDGKTLSSSILGLVYTDTNSGQSVMFSELQDSIGQILPGGSAAVYPWAFSNLGDVYFEYSRSSL